MKLILEAIKALFRKLENSIPKSLNDILRIIGNERIPGQYVEDMYHGVPSTLSNGLTEQTVTISELTTDSSWVREDGVPTYGCDIQDFVPADYGITDNLLGSTFVVVWDGVEYECVSHDGDGMEMFILGNANICNAKKDNSGEPFCIIMDLWYGGTTLYIRTNDSTSIHTIAFGTPVKKGKLKKMPRQYLPDHDHGVVPIIKGGTGGQTNEEVLLNLGLLYVGYSHKIVESKLQVIVNDNFKSAEGSLVVLIWKKTAPNNTTLASVAFKDITVPLSGNYNWDIANGKRVCVLCYDGEKFRPLDFAG